MRDSDVQLHAPSPDAARAHETHIPAEHLQNGAVCVVLCFSAIHRLVQVRIE